MNKLEVLKELKILYPGKEIKLDNESEPLLVVCETDPKKGESVIVLDKSEAHFHRVSTERYLVLNGKLELYVDGKKNVLRKGEIYDILPGQVHSANGSSTWIKEISTPPWSKEDHFEIKE